MQALSFGQRIDGWIVAYIDNINDVFSQNFVNGSDHTENKPSNEQTCTCSYLLNKLFSAFACLSYLIISEERTA